MKGHGWKLHEILLLILAALFTIGCIALGIWRFVITYQVYQYIQGLQ